MIAVILALHFFQKVFVVSNDLLFSASARPNNPIHDKGEGSHNQLKVRLCLTSLDYLVQTLGQRSDVVTVKVCGGFIEGDELR